MSQIRWLVVVLVALTFACSKKEAPEKPAGKPTDQPMAEAPADPPMAAAPAAAPAPKPSMKALKVTAAKDWKGEFSPGTETWTYEKYTPAGDGTNAPNRFYVDAFPEDRPRDVEAYAEKLQKDKNFQDLGSLFISVARKDKLPNGWLIVGVQKDMGDAADKGAPAFVLYRSDLNVYCRGGVFRSEALREEAIAACKAMTL
jgi:hypothetical protein